MQYETARTTPEIDELPVVTVWPSIAAFPLGRWVGRMCGLRLGFGRFFTLGKLLAVATIPVSLAVYFWRVAPWVARRYSLTDRRLIIRQGLSGAEGPSIGLLDFDSIGVETLPGQEFLRAGDLVFQSDGLPVFRLSGVQHPETFRQLCLKTRLSLASVAEVLHRQNTQVEKPATTGSSA